MRGGEDCFERRFGFPHEAEASAPGRVNLLGEHTDYSGGFVLPTVIPQQARVALGESRDARDQFASAQFPLEGAAGSDFGRYLHGCVQVLRERGARLPPVRAFVDSEVPIGAGLSSSAAVEIAMLRALRSRYALPLDDVELALAGQEAERRFAGVQSGIMDQMAASVGMPGRMLFLDTRSLSRELRPLPANSALLVLDSGLPRTLAGSAYNTRRFECEQAARALGVAALRDVTELSCVATLPEPLNRRARHVVSENARVQLAAASPDPVRFGTLMNASHESLRADFEVSTPGLDALVGLLQRHPATYGAKLTGAGFGGACVALVHAGQEAAIARAVLDAYADLGGAGARLV